MPKSQAAADVDVEEDVVVVAADVEGPPQSLMAIAHLERVPPLAVDKDVVAAVEAEVAEDVHQRLMGNHQ